LDSNFRRRGADAWTHAAIQLEPLNGEFQKIRINPDQVDELRVVAEFIRVLP
jgi:SOS-response transcriptional repressor LexA